MGRFGPRANLWGWVATLTLAGCIEDVESEARGDAALLADAAAARDDATPPDGAAPPPDADTAIDIDAAGSGGDGQAARPCLAATAPDLPPARVGSTVTATALLTGCGDRGVAIADVRVEGDDAGAFSVGVMPPLQVPRGGTIRLDVRFTPPAEAAYAARLVLVHDGCADCRTEVPLVGRGVSAEPPEPRVAQQEFDVEPLAVVELDGSLSVDGGLPITGWRWTVVERPAGSTARPAERFGNPRRPQDGQQDDDPSTPTAKFFVDLAGDYRILLRVDEAEDAPSAEVRIHARPGSAIHVQLVWHNPADPDQTDVEGSDVDLHFLHPQARGWGVAPLDCYFANAGPDWGVRGTPDDDPSLDIDDTDGAGPENINLDRPEDTSQYDECYQVGVHYFRDENNPGGGTWGPADATVRVYLGGELAYEKTRALQSTENFWHVAAVCWTEAERRVVDVDHLYQSVPLTFP